MVTASRAALAEAVQRRIDGIEAQRDLLADEARALLQRSEDAGALGGPDKDRFTAIEAELAGLREQRDHLTAVSRSGGFEGVDGVTSGYAPPQSAGGELVTDRASRALEALHTRGLPDHAAERCERLVATDTPGFGVAARWIQTAGAPEYESAFAKWAADPQRGHLLWSERERAAWAEVQHVRAALAESSTHGAELLPIMLDPTVLLTSAGSADPLRRISRVVQIATSEWRGVTSAGSSAEWKAEGVTVADASPTFSQPTVPVHLADAFTPFSYEVQQDAAGLMGELQAVLTDAMAQLQAAGYMNGTGSGQPTGLVTGLPSGSKVAAATADTIVAGDVTGLQNSLPPRFQARAQWCANLATINTIGSMETANGSLRFPEVANDRLLRKPLNEASELDAAGHTASAGNDHVLLYGDFSQFLIADRIGAQVEIVQNLFDTTTGRPTGQRGALLWLRTGSDVLVDNAFRLLTA